jgi:hypothetical protein
MIREYNAEIKKEIPSLKVDYHNDQRQLNLAIAQRFLNYVAERIGEIPEQHYWANESKGGDRLYQLELHLVSGNILYAAFVVVDNEKIIASRTNVELVNSNYDTIRHIIRRGKINKEVSK